MHLVKSCSYDCSALKTYTTVQFSGDKLCTCIAVLLFIVRWSQSKLSNSGPHFLVNFFYQFEEGQGRQLCMDLDAVIADC